MGGAKKQNLNNATGRAKQGQALEDQRAQELHDQTQGARSVAQSNMAAVNPNIQSSLDPNANADINNQLKQSGFIGTTLVDPTAMGKAITDASFGRGREGYNNLATTGGMTPEQQAAYLRQGTAPVKAIYSNLQDEANRRLAITGGYSPTFGAGTARMVRAGANDAAEAGLNSTNSLNTMLTKNKLEGLQGLERTREAAGKEATTGILGASESLRLSAQGQAALKDQNVQNMLKYYQSNVDQMSQADKTNIANRLAQLGMTQADIDAMLGAAKQQKSWIENANAYKDFFGGIAADAITGASGASGAKGGK